ncbi:hypothetical protein CL648_05095 [bacterium]|nr:hypothetical protein [bacterium]|tara:strand:+ start:2349 stop:2657 length:309 start_codon:yes stop_codon:yes gene_type:complete
MKLFDPAMVALQNAIKRSTATQARLARDIANSSTPGYTSSFSGVLEEVENKQKKRRGLESRKATLESNMSRLSQLNLYHSACSKLLTTKLSILKTVAAMGKK